MTAVVLAIGFGITVAMWGIGYLARLPMVEAPAPAILPFLLLAGIAGGWVAGRFETRGLRAGALAGGLAGVLNLLILGAFLTRGEGMAVHPSAVVWVPGSILLTAALGAGGAALGLRSRGGRPAPEVDWTASFSRVALAATFLLLAAGGIVTSANAGLAVVDWPNSFGSNMFLFPFSRMTGGIYYEHAHRLLGSLVGLTTLVLTIHLLFVESRRWVKALAVAAFVLVCVQGILGGLRVTGTLTLSQNPDDVSPNLSLAVAHGILGQLFFSTMAALTVFLSPSWKGKRPLQTSVRAATDRALHGMVLVALVVQLVLGAVQRHLAAGLVIHITLAFVVAGLAIAAGTRAWGFHADLVPLRRSGLFLAAAAAVQFGLGFTAFVVTAATPSGSGWDVVVSTAHQATGALLLGCAVALALWHRRLVAVQRTEPARAASPGIPSSR
jgi:cytochrome c oxidase assembly protein subunit 15